LIWFRIHFQHEAFCSLLKVITRVATLIRSVGATFRPWGKGMPRLAPQDASTLVPIPQGFLTFFLALREESLASQYTLPMPQGSEEWPR